MRILTLLLLTVSLSSCHIGKKLEKTASLIISPEFTIQNKTTASSAVYVNNSTLQVYQNDFMNDLKGDLASHNIVLADFGAEADYELVITDLYVIETISTEVIDDAESSDNGMVFYLSDCDVVVEMTLYEGDGKRVTKIDHKVMHTDKEEKVKENEKNHTYRERTLSSDVFRQLARKSGRNTVGWMSNHIAKDQKRTGGY